MSISRHPPHHTRSCDYPFRRSDCSAERWNACDIRLQRLPFARAGIRLRKILRYGNQCLSFALNALSFIGLSRKLVVTGVLLCHEAECLVSRKDGWYHPTHCSTIEVARINEVG
jgi:hypothetical protein